MGNTEEETKKWREERKRNYPKVDASIKRKSEKKDDRGRDEKRKRVDTDQKREHISLENLPRTIMNKTVWKALSNRTRKFAELFQ